LVELYVAAVLVVERRDQRGAVAGVKVTGLGDRRVLQHVRQLVVGERGVIGGEGDDGGGRQGRHRHQNPTDQAYEKKLSHLAQVEAFHVHPASLPGEPGKIPGCGQDLNVTSIPWASGAWAIVSIAPALSRSSSAGSSPSVFNCRRATGARMESFASDLARRTAAITSVARSS